MSLKESIVSISNDNVWLAFAELFALHSIPHRIIDSASFITALNCYRNASIGTPNRHQLRHTQAELAQQLRSDVVSRLRQYCRACPLSIAVDGWTNTRHDKVTNIICLCGGNAYYWCSIVNTHERNTAAWLSEPIKQAMHNIKQQGVAIVALVADNESINGALYRLLLPHYPFLILSPCAAHTIQLCVNKSFMLSGVKEVMSSMEALLSQFSSSKEYRQRLKRLQLAASEISDNSNRSSRSQVLCLIKPCDTRWSSHIACARRLIRLQPWINIISPQPQLFWSSLSSLVQFLQPFEQATDIIQSDSSTLYTVYQQFSILLKHVNSIPPSSFFYSLKAQLKAIILTNWENHVNIPAVITSAQLSFDTSVEMHFSSEQTTDARHWFINFASEYAFHYHLSLNSSKDSIRLEVLQQWSDFCGRAAEFGLMDQDINDIKQKQLNDNRSVSTRSSADGDIQTEPQQQQPHYYSYWDPKKVWYLYLQSAPVISHAAIALLSVAGSEAAVERTFSAQDAVHTKKRNRLLDASVENEMFIKFNTLAMKKETSQPHYVLLTDDFVECGTNGTVADLFRSLVAPSGDDGAIPLNDQDGKEEQPQHEEEEQQLPAAPVILQIEQPPVPVDHIERFITSYVASHNITTGYRWSEDRMNALEQTSINFDPPIKILAEVLKKKIMSWVNNPSLSVVVDAAENASSSNQ